MAYVDLSAAHDRCAALREVIIHHPGGWADRAALDKVQRLCGAVRTAVDDAGCHEQVALVEKFAADLYSEMAQQRAEQHHTGGMTRADYLRLQILRELNELDTRLLAIEKLRAGEARRAQTGYLLNSRS